MSTARFTKGLLLAAALGTAGAFYANAGDLNPPPGPVSPTGVTLTEIADAVAGVQNSVDNLGGSSAPADLVFGLSIPGSAGEGDPSGIIDPTSTLVFDYDLAFEIPVSPGAGGGSVSFGAPGVTRFALLVNIDAAYPGFYDAIALNGIFPSLTLRGYEAGPGAPELREIVEVSNASIVGLEETATRSGQRALRLDFIVTGQICIERIPVASSPRRSCYSLPAQP
jgi:hypothetical protein